LIAVTGTVSDIRPYLWKATMAVVPLVYGAGIQNKILEAMGTGTPVITTSKAISALHVHPGKDILVAGTPKTFSSEILRLMDDSDYRTDIAEAGLLYVRRYHDWTVIAKQMVAHYLETTNGLKRTLL
jgi:spore maturation protein CgeB